MMSPAVLDLFTWNIVCATVGLTLKMQMRHLSSGDSTPANSSSDFSLESPFWIPLFFLSWLDLTSLALQLGSIPTLFRTNRPSDFQLERILRGVSSIPTILGLSSSNSSTRTKSLALWDLPAFS